MILFTAQKYKNFCIYAIFLLSLQRNLSKMSQNGPKTDISYCRVGSGACGTRLSDLSDGDLRGLCDAVGDDCRHVMAADSGFGALRGADAGEYESGSLAVENAAPDVLA